MSKKKVKEAKVKETEVKETEVKEATPAIPTKSCPNCGTPNPMDRVTCIQCHEKFYKSIDELRQVKKEKAKEKEKEKKEKANKFIRPQSIALAITNLGNQFTFEQLVAEADKIFQEHGGKSNPKESAFCARYALPVLEGLNIVHKTDDGYVRN